MKQSASSRKTNEQARETIANILLFALSDPRLSSATITGCEVSYDKSVCNVFYSAAPETYVEVAKAFEGAKGHIRSLMARRLSWRVAPELRFILDESVDEAERIGRALLRERDRMENRSMADEDVVLNEHGELGQQKVSHILEPTFSPKTQRDGVQAQEGVC